MARFLWDEPLKGSFKTKDENCLSDFVKDHLDGDLRVRGIIVNREVEIRRSTGGAAGQRTDIHVDAVSRRAGEWHDRVSVIIEAKGSWNAGLFDNMKVQLAERYLYENQCQYGLYLVGWYNCANWASNDGRRNACRGIELGELKRRLHEQASELSAGGLCLRAIVLDVSLR